MLRLALIVGVVIAIAGAAAAEPVVREERAVVVDGVRETWRLVWRSPPRAAAGFEPDDPDGEAGVLDLVRLRSGREIDRLPLTPLFALADATTAPPQARLPARAQRVLALADYDHDGAPTELVLQVDRIDSSVRPAVLIGLDARSRRLHVFHTVEHADAPLVLDRPELWTELAAAASVHAVALPCGDHGGEFEDVLDLSADRDGLHATLREYDCTGPAGTRGALIERRAL